MYVYVRAKLSESSCLGLATSAGLLAFDYSSYAICPPLLYVYARIIKAVDNDYGNKIYQYCSVHPPYNTIGFFLYYIYSFCLNTNLDRHENSEKYRDLKCLQFHG